VRAQVLAFDFSSLISESSFLSLVRAVAPRNVVLLQPPPPSDPLVARLEESLEGYFTHIHTPPVGIVVTLPATACYVASLSPALAAVTASAGAVARPPYRLGWLDGMVTGVPLLL
jgi:hypothetical protein